MIAIEVPTLRSAAGNWRGVSVETAELAGSTFTVTTVREISRPTRRRWFGDERDALAWAAEKADELNLPLFDFRAGGDGE